ncbi:MAG: carboxyl transferase, partial [Desulfobacterales bacterium]|nr:carboxyl transferase [Desulfobacterales bacterium]
MSKSKDTSNNNWKPEIEEIKLREKLAAEMGGPENIQRQHSAGRLTVRERLAKFLDKNSFHEVGAIAGVPTYDGERLVKLQPSNCVIGSGTIDKRKIIVGCDDFTIRGGAADAAIGRKAAYAERMALDMRLPMVRLIEGTGGGGSVKFLETMSYTYVPANPALDVMAELLSTVPVACAALGPVAGLGAARTVFSLFSVMPKKIGQLFVAGPPVVEPATGKKITKEELGGYKIHTRESGVIDNEVESEEEAFEHIQKFLSYLP